MSSTSHTVRRDFAMVALISVITAVVCVRFDVSEKLMGWTRLRESWQADELPVVLLVFATCLIWFSARRYLETRRQLGFRAAIEIKLAAALEENQRLAQQYIDIQETERKALARDLHDELGQFLHVIKLDAVSIRDAPNPDTALIADASRAMIDNVDRVYAVVAGLIRQLRPAGFDELGVTAALQHCLTEWRGRLPLTVIHTSIDTDLDELDEIRALALFRLVQEAMNNIARHSQATRVDIRIDRRRDAQLHEFVDLTVRDNGCGVDLEAPRVGLGLIGMRERAAAFGGSVTLSSVVGQGFEVSTCLPVTVGAKP